jgi:ABC-type glycerol-3-phosphate transport system permease component
VAYSAVFMLAGYGVALGMAGYYHLMNVSLYLILRALICTPINIFILNNLFKTYPRVLAAARYE